MSENKVTIIIPNYNGIKYLNNCLLSLGKQTVKAPVIVVDNGSVDGSIDRLREDMKRDPDSYPEIIIEELGHNTGFAYAVNAGVNLARTKYVLLINNDTTSDEEMTEKLIDAAESSNRIFSVSAKMLSMKNKDVIDDSGDLYCALGWAFSPGRDKAATGYNRRARITSACAGAAIYRRDYLLKIGGFDDVHFCYLEDVDVGYRARIYGYTNLYEPSALVYHAGSGTSGSRHNEFKEKLTVSNNIYMIYKNMPVLQIIINLPLLILGNIIKLAYFTRKGLGVAYLKGLKWGFSKISEHGDRKVTFKWRNLVNYFILEIEILYNCFRRLVG